MYIKERAAANLEALSRNPYPGRGIVLGRTFCLNPVQIYWIMGRSEGSRNRILEPIPEKHGWLRTCIADQSKFQGDPSLLIYTAMAEEPDNFVVSNGAQTDAVMKRGIGTLNDWRYEPDKPNFTPRITGITRLWPGDVLDTRLIMLRKSDSGYDECDRFDYVYGKATRGFGFFISTYEGDGNPLPAFHGEPLILPIEDDDPAQIAEAFWSVLNPENRVALAVKVIPHEGPSKIKIINRHEKS